MRLHLFLGAGALLGLAACQSQAAHERDHWTGYYVGPSLSRAFLSYDPETDGTYREFQWRKKKNIELTLRRHFFNHNPENPFEADDKTVYEPRPTQSLLPNPIPYIHIEGLVLGAAAMGAGGAFFPLPIDSFLGTMEDGGEEFMEGVGTTARPLGDTTQSFLHDALGFPGSNQEAWEKK